MELELLSHLGKPKPSNLYTEFLIFDYEEGNNFLNECPDCTCKVATFCNAIIDLRKKLNNNETRIIHAFSAALKTVDYDSIPKGQLKTTLEAIYADKTKRREFEHEFLVSTAQITYRGRHRESDEIVKNYFKDNTSIKYFDIGCCPEKFGAITSEETFSLIPKADITAIDIHFPPDFKPANRAINYIKDNIVTMTIDAELYDVIRYVNLELFFNEKTRELVHRKLVNALKINGLFINGRESRGYNIYRRVS
ncbi:MAG TPA: hypothetical protein DCS13_09800 [Candidatus Margulisbacteria bacterium]|nr:MAG: hypothetical protein A2X43_08065 [Candidatus Margulisbacteria bacterium GWD2_39_127]HAR63745.1 hypothetical protein [Candidatus Margulisiibacteriota bacterium]